MKLWILLTDDDGGLTLEVYTDQAKAEADATAWVVERWSDDYGTMPAWRDAVEFLSDQPGFMDSISLVEKELVL